MILHGWVIPVGGDAPCIEHGEVVVADAVSTAIDEGVAYKGCWSAATGVWERAGEILET